MHSSLHEFCREDRVSTLDIVLDIEKPYPLIFRHSGNQRQCFTGDFFSVIAAVGLNYSNWFSIT